MTEKEHTAWQAGWQSAILDMVNEDKCAGLITEYHRLMAERDRLREALGIAEAERDFLVSEYERALNVEPQGFAHAAAHLYNAIVNAKCDVNADRFIKLMDERDRLREALEEVLADHDERIRLYSWREGQTNRLRGIGLARAALREVSDDNT
jgi:hypothetical protein